VRIEGPLVREASNYIGGRWCRSTGVDRIEVINPATESVIAIVPVARPADVAGAVTAAQTAFSSWSRISLAERSKHLSNLARVLEQRREEIAQTATLEVGTPISQSRPLQADLPIRIFHNAARELLNMSAQDRLGNSLVRRVPIGVVGCISPWNYPLYLLSTKVAGALAAGCTVVAKASHSAPLSALLLADAADSAGLPPGVFNLVCGTADAGRELVADPRLAMVSFTGSTQTGRAIAQAGGRNLARLSLELGGKSASIVLEDADIDRAVNGTVAKCFQNAGQTCTALARILVPEHLVDSVAGLAEVAASRYVPADPQLETTLLGPLASAEQRDRVLDYVRSGTEAGAKLVTGGPARPAGVERGYFVRATVFSGVTPDMAIAREEIFGPVLCIIGYRNEADAVEIANGTEYGLAAAVWSIDHDRALQIAGRLRAGSIGIDGGATNPEAPFGGFGHSGYGRERGRYGIDEFSTTVAFHLPGSTDTA
jgi:aldehyde dehydrogenase (NAD+)